MSFAKVISLISTMTPTGIGFFGYTWEILGNFFVYIFTYVVNAFYGVCKWFLAFVDFLQYFIQKLIGLDYWLSPGGKDLKGATESDLLFSFLYNETVQDVFRALIGLFIVFLIIFTVFAIIRQEWKFVTGTEKDNTKGKILSGSLKAIALVVITPLILVIGIVSSNAILASIVKALNIDMSSTFGNTIFSIASVNANKYRIYTDSGERTPVSQQVTFYINSDEELVLYGSAASDEYQKVYDDYDEYLEAIDSADKYTVNSMLPIVIPSQHSEFYGYCISLNIDGNLKYFMVEVDVDNANSAESKEKISAMYYYLRNVLRANIMSRNNNIGSADILKALGGDISSAVSTTPCLISEFDLDGCKEDKVYEACYNTWDYATIYRTETAFEATTASTLVMNLDDYYISGQSNAKIVYNAYDYQKYFDGGQFGFVGLNAEYGVMTDVIDFICETGANLYILDATSSLINWNYEDYQIEGKWVSEITGGAPTMYNAYGEEYLPFIVDYSETAMDHEEGKTLYFAKANVSNELEGSKFIMCWKVSTDSGVKYVPLLNRETFTDPVTKQTYTFKSTYLSNSYKGLVVAKGNFDQEITSSVNGPDNGDPTYFKVGASLGDGEEAIEYTNEPYYYDIAESGELQQYVSDLDVSAHAQNNMTLKNINFDNSSFPNYALVFDSIDKSLFRFVDTNTNAEVDITTNIINSLTVRFVNGSNKNDSAVYAGVNDGTNYLFVSSGTGRVLMLSLTDSRTLTVRGIGEDGSISTSRVVPSEIESSVNNFNSPIFLYKITLNYDDGHETDTYEIKPLDLQFSKTADGKSLFSSIEKYYIVMNGASTDIKQNMTICAYFNESSLYNIVDGKLEMATFSASNKYTLQMFRVSLYDFMVGYVDGAVCKYVASNSEGHRVVTAGDSDIVDSFDFGIVVDGFEWIEDNTEYSVFNGSSYIAKLLKTKGTTFGIENVAEDSKTIGIEIDGNRYYNVKTQNMYSDEDSMEDAYDIINNSMFVGCYRDRATTDFWSCDFHFSLVGNFRFKLKLNLPVLENEQLMNKNYGVFSLTDGIAFDYFFEGDNSLVQFYNAYKVAYWIILIASALIIKTLGTALWGVIKRFYEVTLYYLAMPIAASTMPLDGGKKFGQIQEGLIKNVLGAYGVILGINMFFILLSPVKSLSNIFTQAEMDSSTSYFLRHFPFGAKVLNNYVYILFVLVAFTMIDTLPSVINGLVGGKDVVAEGKTTKENVQKSVKSAGDMISGKSAMDFAGKTVSALSQTPMAAPIKWAAGKVKGGVDSVIGSFNRGASQDDDDAAQKGGDKQKSSRADGSDETQTTSQETGETAEATEATEANETTEMQNANSRADGEFEEGENSNAADESQEADIAAEFNKEQANAELGEEGKVDAIKEAAENGEKQELTNAIATNIVGDKETLNKENAAEFGLDENAVREIVRQMLGEQGKNMSDEELDKFAIAIDKDVFGNIKGATVKTTDENGNEQEVASVDGEQASKAIVENASNEKVKEAYSNLDDDQKDMVDGAIAADASGVSFSEEKHKEATDEQKTEAIKDMAKSDENQEVSNAIAGELIDKKMNETAQQNDNEEPAVEVAEIDKDYAAELGIDKKLEAGQTISAEEAGISESEAQRIKEDILGSKEVELNKNQQTAISKNLRNLGVEEGQVVSEKQSGLDKDELLELKKNTLGAKAENMSPEQLDKYELIFAKDEKGNVSASLQIPTDDISDEELKKHKLEFTKDENGVISAKVTAPEEENKTDVAATIDASAVLTEEQIRQIVSEILGVKATEEQIAKSELKFTRDENGNMSASIITPPQQNNNEQPAVEVAEIDKDYAAELGIDKKLEAGQTISAEEAGISESEAQRIKEDILGSKEVELNKNQQTAISKNLRNLGVEEGQVVSEKQSGLDKDELLELKKNTLGAKAENMSPEQLDKYELIFAKDEKGNVSASLQIPTDDISDEELKKHKLEFTKDENGVISAKVTAPEEENKTDVAATIDASAVLTEEQIRQIISDILGEKATGLTEEQLAEYKLQFTRDENGNMSASVITPPQTKEYGFELEEEYASEIGIDEKLQAGQTISAEEAGISEEQMSTLKDMALGEEGEKLSDEELAKYKLEFTKDENGVVSAKVTAPEDENKTDVAATIDASAVLSEEQIRQIISESLGEKTTGQTSEQRQEIKLDDKQMASVNSKILENASDEEVNGAYQNLGNNLKAKVDSYASENFAEKEVVNVAPENATLANASLNALRAIDKYKDDENVENAVILKTLEADPEKMKSFMYESGLSENASKDEKLEVIAQMKNSQNANAVSMTLKDINEKGLTDAHAQVVAEMMADGKIKTTAWDLATEEEKQQFRQKRKDEKQEFSADEKKVATELNMQAVRDYEAADKADYDKKIVDAYVSSENIEFKDTLSTNLLLSATGLKNETGKAYKDAAKEIQSAELSDGKKINMAELAQKGYSPEMVMAAYAKMKILADKDGKIGEDSVKNDNGKLNAELLMKMLEKPNDNTDIALSKLTDSDVKARAIVSDMLMKGDKDSTPLLTSDEQEGIVAKIAEGDGKGGFLAEQSGSKEFYDKVVAETQKRNQVNEIYDTQSDNIDVKQLNDFGNTQILQNKVMGAMIETSEGGGDNFKNSKDYADLLREFTGDTKTKHGQDKSDKEMTQSYKIIATKDEKGNYSYSVGKKVNGKIVETKALTEDQVRSLQEKYMKNFKSGTIENSKLKSAFDKLSAAEQSLLASRNKDKGKAMQDLFANNDNNSNYQALLDQINAMRTKAGEANVSEITSADLQKLINNEDNLGYDPIELENLKKEIIRQKIDSSESQVITKVVDSSKLSGKEKDNFEYRKTIIEDQVKAEGDNSETLANLFKNSNFVGKDELQKEIEDIINNLKDKQENKDKSNEQLFAMALNQRLAVKNESEIQSEIKNYMEANAGVSKEEAETVVRQKNQQAENTRNLLYSVGATDVTKAISDDNLKDKQKEAIKSDIVLSRQLADAGIKETDSDYDAKLQALMASNASFALRLNEKVQNMIDPSKQISAEDKERFFKSKSQEDLTTKKFGPITEGIKAKNKTRKHLPKESKKYDEWNNLIDKDMEAVKSGKGAYKNLSKEDRKAKLDELKSKKINTERPEDYYDWDYAKQKEYDDNQNILKNEALNTNISKVKKKDIKAFKPKDKNVILKFADATGDKLSDVPVLRAITSKFASDDLKAKHNKELLLEEEKIARFNSSAPMRKRSEDFGSNFENFAKSYISKKSIDRIQKDVASKGLTGEAAIKAREEAFAKQMNKNYKVASAKVARDNRVDKNEFLVEKGINAGSVRYKDGTKKYTEVKSRLGRKTAKIVQKYEKEYASGNVSDKTRKKYEKSTFANRSEEAAIKVKNQQKLYDQVVEFNRSYKRGDGDYATLFKQKFGDELYKKYNSAGIRDLEKSPAIVQQRELIKRIENELKKNINRQKYSSYIPASDKAKDRFRADTLTNAKTKAAVEHDRQMMAHFSNAMKQFKAQTAGGKTINPDEFMKSINPAVLGKHLQDFKGVDNEFIKNYLEKGFEKYRKRVVNNSFTPSQLQNLVKLNGTYVDKSKVQNSRISNTVLKSLRASDAEVYKNIIKSVNSARAKADNEAANLQSLKQALKSAQSGVQNNAAKAEAEKIRKAIANSEIKLNNLKNVLGAEEARKKAFEQAIASDRIKKAIRENSKSAPAAPSRPHDYSKPDGSPRIIKPGTLDHRQVQKLERYFMANARAELENMAKLIASKESQKLVDEINKTRRDLSYDARENVKKLKALQLKIKKELKNLVTKNDKKTKRYQDELKMQNAKIDGTIKKMSEEFAKMDIII